MGAPGQLTVDLRHALVVGKLASVPAYRITITLQDVTPQVWRRVVLPGQWHLGQVHLAVQTAMGWDNSHLHEFTASGLRYGVPDPTWGDNEVRRETTARLHEVVVGSGDSIAYWYDFGDDWHHDLVVEEVLPPQRHAQCLAGTGACPPEDCGGPWGYSDLVAALGDPAHPEREELMTWVPADFDPIAFDADGVDARLRSL